MPQTKFFTTSHSCALPNKETYLNNISYNDMLTRAMAEFSYDRMEKHRSLILNNIEKLLEHKEDLMKILGLSDDQFNAFKKELEERGEQHDLSKYSDPEKIPYIHLNWKHHMEKDLKKEYVYSDEIRETIDNAIHHHWKVNSHHPEFHYFKDDNTLEDNKEKIKHSLEKMSNLDLLEMLADWMAVSQEYKTDCKEFAKNNIGDDKRWPFSEEQKTKIDRIVDTLEQALQANNDSSYQQKSSLSR